MKKIILLFFNQAAALARSRRIVLYLASAALLLLLLLFLLAWGIGEVRRLQTRHYTLALANLPAAQDGLKIAVISDLHLYSGLENTGLLDKIYAKLAEEQPDLIFLPGDFVHYRGPFPLPALPEITRIMRNFRAPCGTYAVPGNHDTKFLSQGLRQALRDGGVTLLEEQSTRPLVRGKPLQIAGVSDYGTAGSDAVRACRALNRDLPILLLCHNPDFFLDSRENPADLTVAGHLHGGQIRLPWLGARYTPSRLFSYHDPGLYFFADRNRHLLLTAGVGTSSLPVRVLCPPEIVFLTLRQKEAAVRQPDGGTVAAGALIR